MLDCILTFSDLILWCIFHALFDSGVGDYIQHLIVLRNTRQTFLLKHAKTPAMFYKTPQQKIVIMHQD